MKAEQEENKRFRHDAKGIVDMMHDTKYFKESVSRDDMNAIEDYLTFVMQASFESHLRIDALTKRIEAKQTVQS